LHLKSGVTKDAMEIHRRAVVVDLHADTPTMMRFGYDLFKRHRPILPMSAWGFHLDVPRMHEGGLTGQFFGLVTFPLTRVGLFDTALKQINLVRDAARLYPTQLRIVTEAKEIVACKSDGSLAVLFGVEGAHALEGSLENLDILARVGLRYVGLTHFTKNSAASPAMGLGGSKTGGLTEFGRNLVEKCNNLGVLVDLAHSNRKTFKEALELSRDPVIVSHTGLNGVRRLWRNIDDEQIRGVADKGGCIGIIFSRYFLGGKHVSRLVNHICHCLDVGGEGCPALGSDFDGLIVPPKELPDVSALPRLTQELLNRGLGEDTIHKILGGNVLRVMREVPASISSAPLAK